MENISRDLSSTINACFSLFECLIPAPAFEEVVLGHRRFRLIKQVQGALRHYLRVAFTSILLLHPCGETCIVAMCQNITSTSSRQNSVLRLDVGTCRSQREVIPSCTLPTR